MAGKGSAPAVSVLMPVWNGARFVEAAMASLAAQSFRDLEIVAVDNGSTDETPRLLAQWEAREPRLRVARLERARLAQALNLAAELARAPLLARLDADDIAFPRRLETQLSAMAARPELGVLGSAAMLIDARGREIGSLSPPLRHADILRAQRTSCALIPSSTIVRAALLRNVGGYRQGLNVSEDFDLWTRLTEIARAANLDEALIGYRVHGGSVTARQPARMALASLCVVAAAEARRSGRPEPFRRGVPNLRVALPLLGLERTQARRTIRLRCVSNALSRRLIALRLPIGMKRLSHRVARLLRLKRLYRSWLSRAHGTAPGEVPRDAPRPAPKPLDA